MEHKMGMKAVDAIFDCGMSIVDAHEANDGFVVPREANRNKVAEIIEREMHVNELVEALTSDHEKIVIELLWALDALLANPIVPQSEAALSKCLADRERGAALLKEYAQ